MKHARRFVAGTLAAGALALSLTGCGDSVDPIERMGPKTTEAKPSPSASAAPDGGTEGDRAYEKWGLSAPLQYAPKPVFKPLIPPGKPGQAPILNRIPVPADDKVVFLTFDDGAEKDPEFLRMAADLKLPISMFLTDKIASVDYGHFEQLRDNGSNSTINNHTLSHLKMRTLSFAEQKREICGQQVRLEKRFGTKPTLFRPPYGNYNDDTLKAAHQCGITQVLLWRASMQIHDFQYAEGSGLQPGDIILAHFRGPKHMKGTTETQMVTAMLQRIQEQGFRIGRVEDYL
ncbi:polysaccharide deacetylase family protein [Streptomyces sp. H34-S4]|uniref:polysaccharide deacetylase family protein n=1 Tax=Streptomyces sp. H34-S4 TaxID=2996463 RepID=UPI0022708300|nr:polysaccharide deacetylase family protein [Streptomyces sp. H34-S4]MCY0932925.1 polysaccharide deacetylase family protein [Streptomyces sp. H34-S4]